MLTEQLLYYKIVSLVIYSKLIADFIYLNYCLSKILIKHFSSSKLTLNSEWVTYQFEEISLMQIFQVSE